MNYYSHMIHVKLDDDKRYTAKTKNNQKCKKYTCDTLPFCNKHMPNPV